MPTVHRADGSTYERRPRSTKAQVEALKDALRDAVEQDTPVTVRGVYYRAVSAGLIPKTEAGYEQVRDRLVEMRRAGQIDHEDIIDGTRSLTRWQTHDSIGEMLARQARTFRLPIWPDQGCMVIIATEKDAISNLLEPITGRYDVPLGIMRGYSSETFAWKVAQYVAQHIEDPDVPVYLYQFGDHDPSGVDAWRAFEARVGQLSHADIEFERIAVTPDQIEDMGLITRPTKPGDPRTRKWDGGESVEVDAITPSVIRELVTEAIERHIDEDILNDTEERSEAARATLEGLAEQYR